MQILFSLIHFNAWQGVLLSGPPGTGKTLFARTLAKESGMPFVFASGAEFTDSEKSGAARINEMFSIARRNVSLFLLVTILTYRDENVPQSNKFSSHDLCTETATGSPV